MDRKITREILESFLKCEYKSHLQLIGQKGTISDFENMLRESRANFEQQATENIDRRYMNNGTSTLAA